MPTIANLNANFIGAVVFVFGLLIGSFLNVVIYRLPKDESIVWPGSHCPNCQRALSVWENLPVASWLVLRGRCFGCKQPISWRYPLNELATAGLFLAVYAAFGATWQTAFLLVLVALLIVTFWIDIDHMLILDVVTIPGALLGLVYAAVVTHTFWFSLAAVLAGVALLLLLNGVTMLAIGRDGIGGGDFTLVAMLGAWLGLKLALLALGLAVVAGAVIGLVMLFGGWLKERRWQPFAIAGGVALPVFWGVGALFAQLGNGPSFPSLLWAGEMAPGVRAALAAFAALVGASAGWLYMRAARDEGYLEMPFGPALVLGALGALFWGVPLVDWYAGRLGTF